MLIMPCETELLLRKAFADAIREAESAGSVGHPAAHLKMVNTRYAFVNHRASCLLCLADLRSTQSVDE
jgi:hypothetical protein